MTNPAYEVWGLDHTPSDMDGGPARFREDCFTIEEARSSCHEWQSDGRAAWIVNKETGSIFVPAPR